LAGRAGNRRKGGRRWLPELGLERSFPGFPLETTLCGHHHLRWPMKLSMVWSRGSSIREGRLGGLTLPVFWGERRAGRCGTADRPVRLASRHLAPSSSGLGHYPLKVETRVRIPLGLLGFSAREGCRSGPIVVFQECRGSRGRWLGIRMLSGSRPWVGSPVANEGPAERITGMCPKMEPSPPPWWAIPGGGLDVVPRDTVHILV
jgi:hypothetical protein